MRVKDYKITFLKFCCEPAIVVRAFLKDLSEKECFFGAAAVSFKFVGEILRFIINYQFTTPPVSPTGRAMAAPGDNKEVPVTG